MSGLRRSAVAACFALSVGVPARAYEMLALPSEVGSPGYRGVEERAGIPFRVGELSLGASGSARIALGAQARRIFLLGMTEESKPRAWSHPLDYPERWFVGEEVARVVVDYADGSRDTYPLLLGEGLWFGSIFYENPEPFASNGELRSALQASLRLFPAAPAPDGRYVAVIEPKAIPIVSLTVEASAPARGRPVIEGITVDADGPGGIPGALFAAGGVLPSDFRAFAESRALRRAGEADAEARLRLDRLRCGLYTSEEEFSGEVAPESPSGYSGPEVAFKGCIAAEILANAFCANVNDLAAKVGDDGVYHTSTAGAPSWGGYNGFGTYRRNLGKYYDQAWCRDLGRGLIELTELGYTGKAARCADFCLREARLWETDPALKVDGVSLPPHWGRIVNKPAANAAFENDGHGLVSLFLWKLWQRLPNRDAWLRARWPDIRSAGDWILWQFDHPTISGATGVLHTTSECAAMDGNSVYADAICSDALLGLSQMAASIGENGAAERWRARTDRMQPAIGSRYLADDPAYGRTWTLDHAGWPQQSSVLGPLIFQADCGGLAPGDGEAAWLQANRAAYRRLIDTHRPFGFYGQAMGYGQGFVTQAALLLDRMNDATQMLDWTAKEIFDPRIGSFIVPEGCEMDESGRFWYRMGDLGNGVQEAEVVKALRVMVGVDDERPDRLRLFPRLPWRWTEMSVDRYPVCFGQKGTPLTAHLRYRITRTEDQRMTLDVSADRDLGRVDVRLGPFPDAARASRVRVNGIEEQSSPEQSGDSWWARFALRISP